MTILGVHFGATFGRDHCVSLHFCVIFDNICLHFAIYRKIDIGDNWEVMVLKFRGFGRGVLVLYRAGCEFSGGVGD